jgi:hypothetical protein
VTNPDAAAPAGMNLEVFRGLLELDFPLKLLEHLHEQGSATVLSSTSGAPEEVRCDTSLLPIPEILFVWLQHHLLVFKQG